MEDSYLCHLLSVKQHQRERERKVERHEGFKSCLLFIAALVFAWKGAP